MKGSDEQLLSFMDGHDKRFLIPVYQRNYDWKIANCRQLYDDLVKIIRNNRPSHFFGSIVFSYDADSDGSNHEYLIIDGQQRLTTISLLLLALHNLLESKIISSQDELLSNKLLNVYLVDQYAPKETRIKLKPVKNDNEAFHKLFGSTDSYYRNSNLTINYEYFYNRIQKEEITSDELFKAVSKLHIISIKLNNEDNPQMIFESLNSTGVDLSEGDKIRNYVLMGQTKERQNEYYENYWNPIELATHYDVSGFVRDYLSIKIQRTPSINTVYNIFKKYVQDNEIEIEDLLQNLFMYSKYYEILLTGKSSYDELDSKLSIDLSNTITRLNWMETTVTRPFLLEVLKLFFNERLSASDVLEAFSITEDYIFRRYISDVPTNALSKLFLNLNKDILRFDGTDDNYIEKMKYSLSSRRESARFPDDEEFSAALSEKSVYSIRNKFRTYILERFENYGIKEIKNVYKFVEDGTYSIEHIMPQHLSPEWINDIGEDYKRVHEKWLHRLANLTLTAYNSKYSNERFIVKRDLTDKDNGEGIGFKNSGLRLNQWIGLQDKWTEDELIARNEMLINRAKIIWPYVSTDYKPAEKPLDSVSLDDDIDLTGRAIAKFAFKGLEQNVNTWVEAYCQILKILHQQDESILTHLAYESNPEVELAIHVSNRKEDLGTCEEIDSGIYVWTGIGTKYKISNLQKFFKMFGEDPQELIFYLKDDSKDHEEKNEKPRHIIRRKYWTYALPGIKESNVDGCFSNVNPCIQSSIAGYFGINGFKIKCFAKNECAVVEILFYKKNANANKEMYDYLFNLKGIIESQIGKELIWDRGKDVRYSRVMLKLEDVSISNENDWKIMAKFHSEWSKKFYDVMVPLIKGRMNEIYTEKEMGSEDDDLDELDD